MSKPITISVPDSVSEELKKFPNIKVSAVCQEALKKKLEDLKSKNIKDNDLLDFAVKRLKKELLLPAEEYRKLCEEAGERWAAKEASFEELQNLLEILEIDWFVVKDALRDAFFASGCISEQIYHKYEEHDLVGAFEDGAINFAKKIQKRMEDEGFSEFSE